MIPFNHLNMKKHDATTRYFEMFAGKRHHQDDEKSHCYWESIPGSGVLDRILQDENHICVGVISRTLLQRTNKAMLRCVGRQQVFFVGIRWAGYASWCFWLRIMVKPGSIKCSCQFHVGWVDLSCFCLVTVSCFGFEYLSWWPWRQVCSEFLRLSGPVDRNNAWKWRPRGCFFKVGYLSRWSSGYKMLQTSVYIYIYITHLTCLWRLR